MGKSTDGERRQRGRGAEVLGSRRDGEPGFVLASLRRGRQGRIYAGGRFLVIEQDDVFGSCDDVSAL